MSLWMELAGKQIFALKGLKSRKNAATIPVEFILFTDGKTLIELAEQDYHDYHDCSSSARILKLREDPQLWSTIKNSDAYGDSNHEDFY